MNKKTRINLLKLAESLIENIKRCDKGEASCEAGSEQIMGKRYVEHIFTGERVYEFKTYIAAEDKRIRKGQRRRHYE